MERYRDLHTSYPDQWFEVVSKGENYWEVLWNTTGTMRVPIETITMWLEDKEHGIKRMYEFKDYVEKVL